MELRINNRRRKSLQVNEKRLWPEGARSQDISCKKLSVKNTLTGIVIM